jgi:hypothetical protein
VVCRANLQSKRDPPRHEETLAALSGNNERLRQKSERGAKARRIGLVKGGGRAAAPQRFLADYLVELLQNLPPWRALAIEGESLRCGGNACGSIAVKTRGWQKSERGAQGEEGWVGQRRRQSRRTPKVLGGLLGRASTKPPTPLSNAEWGTLRGDLGSWLEVVSRSMRRHKKRHWCAG